MRKESRGNCSLWFFHQFNSTVNCSTSMGASRRLTMRSTPYRTYSSFSPQSSRTQHRAVLDSDPDSSPPPHVSSPSSASVRVTVLQEDQSHFRIMNVILITITIQGSQEALLAGSRAFPLANLQVLFKSRSQKVSARFKWHPQIICIYPRIFKICRWI